MYPCRWAAIASYLPQRTDNDIKNYWNTHLKKRLAKMGIDPVTHKPRADAPASSPAGARYRAAAYLSHTAQWESARLEAEARLAGLPRDASLVILNHYPLRYDLADLHLIPRFSIWTKRKAPATPSGE